MFWAPNRIENAYFRMSALASRFSLAFSLHFSKTDRISGIIRILYRPTAKYFSPHPYSCVLRMSFASASKSSGELRCFI